ncbi:hypothetical protein [Sutcliffiella horikoshii]
MDLQQYELANGVKFNRIKERAGSRKTGQSESGEWRGWKQQIDM